jgi:Arc/MetJ-type ribon-helix-helix transcriptional regulator
MTTIEIPDELAREIDRLAGRSHRSDYASDVLWRDVRRMRQREAIQRTGGSWRLENHPELSEGGGPYVETLRSEPDRDSTES